MPREHAADFGPANAILMGVSAARVHGAVPRAIGTAVVAVPEQRSAITLADRVATVRFVKRDTGRLDAERMRTEFDPTLVTTHEQTVLDLARRPDLGYAADEVRDAVRILIGRADDELLDELATAQRARASLRRARDWARASSPNSDPEPETLVESGRGARWPGYSSDNRNRSND